MQTFPHDTNRHEHELASAIGFYGTRLWWIDTFKTTGGWYRYWIDGRNGMEGNRSFFWNVPSITGQSYAFALKVVR